MNPIVGALIGIAMCLVLVLGGLTRRRNAGEPVGRSAVIWGVLILIAFAVAFVVDQQNAG